MGCTCNERQTEQNGAIADQDQTMIKNVTEHTDEATQVNTMVNRQKRSYTEALQHGTGRLTDTTAGGDEQGWKQVGRGGRVRAGRDNPRPSGLNAKGVMGLKKNTGIHTIEKGSRKRTANIFATRFAPGVSDAILKVYLENKLTLDVTVEKVQTRFDNYASFHIKCECIEPSVFMDPDLWPENAFVRWWKEQRHSVQKLAGLPGAAI